MTRTKGTKKGGQMMPERYAKHGWLPNSLNILPHYILVFTAKEYRAVLKELGIKHTNFPFVESGANACVRHFETVGGGMDTCVVCIYESCLEQSVPYICGMLAHEAVHVYQTAMEYLGEKAPGREIQAYAIQHITEELISTFFNRRFPQLVGKRGKAGKKHKKINS